MFALEIICGIEWAHEKMQIAVPQRILLVFQETSGSWRYVSVSWTLESESLGAYVFIHAYTIDI